MHRVRVVGPPVTPRCKGSVRACGPRRVRRCTQRRGATDPVCAMKVDRAKAVTKHFGGETFYFCSEHCLHAFELDPQHSANARVDPIDGGVAARGWQK